jgi:hypothetical protein
MSTLPELIIHRATAGARYVAAIAELRAAFGDLAAIDACSNRKSARPRRSADHVPIRFHFATQSLRRMWVAASKTTFAPPLRPVRPGWVRLTKNPAKIPSSKLKD